MTLQVFLYELGRNVRRKGYLVTTFGIPLLALLLPLGFQVLTSVNADLANQLSALGQGQAASMRAGYVDQTGMFSDNPGDLTLYADEAAAASALQSGQIDTYYIIPSDYLDSGEVIQVMPTLSLADVDSAPIQQVILNGLVGGLQPQIVQRLEDPASFTEINLQQRTPETSSFDSSFLLVYVFTVSLMLSVFMTNGYLLQGVVEEKESRVVEILLSTLRPSQLLVGKILAFGVMGLLQMVIWIGGIVLILRLSNVLDVLSTLAVLSVPLDILPVVLIYFVLAYLFFASSYGILGALSVSMREGPQFAAIFTLPAAIPLWFMPLFIENPNSPLAIALSIIPVTAPLAMIERIVLTEIPAWQLIASIGLMIVTIVAMLWLAGRLFRVQTLLAGQLPKLRDLPRLVRG